MKLDDVLPRFTDEAISVIEKKKDDRPILLYLAYPAPHTPWLPSKAFEGKGRVPLYGDFVEMVDAEVGRVLAALEKAGMKENTMVLFTADNGPVWYETDVERFGHDSCGGLRGMKGDAWEAGHRMPFIVRWPGKVKPGSTSDRTICFTDVLATYAELLGKRLPEMAGPDSVSFLPALTGGEKRKPPRPPVVMRSARGLMTIRSGDWKLIDGLGSGGFSKPNKVKATPDGPHGQLYHLGKDRAEEKNLWLDEPVRVAELKAQMKKIVEAGRSR